MFYFLIFLLFVFMVMSAYFSGSETAIISANRMRLYSMHLEGEREATEALSLLQDTQRLVAVVLVGNNIALVLTSLVAKIVIGDLAPGEWQERTFLSFNWVELAVLVGLTPVFLLFAEILPKQFFLAQSDTIILKLQISLRAVSFVLMPIVKAVNGITLLLLKPIGIGRRSPLQQLNREEVVEILKHFSPPPSEQQSFPREMIYNVFQLKTTLVREVMKPIVDVVAVRLDESSSVDGILNLARKTGFSRFPVFRDKIVNLIGYVDVYKVLRDPDEQKPLADYVEQAVYIPEIAPVDTLLKFFLEKGDNVAIAIDEFGGCGGWVTIEDIFEEIVGEIHDEFDPTSAPRILKNDHGWVINAQVDIDDINEELGLELPKPHCETLGGLVYSTLERVPVIGEKIEINTERSITLEVIEMAGPKIRRVQLTAKDEEQDKSNNGD
jgi:putative hemolysin